jgi:protein SCO1/2
MTLVATLLTLLLSAPAQATARRYAVSGMILDVDPPQRAFVASIQRIPGFMDAMTMRFTVADAKDLEGLVPGAIVDFTLIVDPAASHAQAIKVRRYESVEQDPLAARRLALMKKIASGRPATAVNVGAEVPDFTLTDHKSRRVSLSQFRGKVVAINFMYTTCQLPEFCLRIVNHFGVLQTRFANELGSKLVFLTITFDPERDTPDVMDRYASRWKPNASSWRFLTGPVGDVQRVLDLFGVSAFPNDGLMDHSLHTALIDPKGTMVANIEGNQYSTDQLADLVRAVLSRR